MSRNRQFSHFLLVMGSPAVCGSIPSCSDAAKALSFFRPACVPNQAVVVGCPFPLPSHSLLLFAPVESSSHPVLLSATILGHCSHPLPATSSQCTSAAVLRLTHSEPHSPADAPHRCHYLSLLDRLHIGTHELPVPRICLVPCIFPSADFTSSRELIFLPTLRRKRHPKTSQKARRK